MYKSYYEGSCDVFTLKDRPVNPEDYEHRNWELTWSKMKFKNTFVSFYRGSIVSLDGNHLERVMLGLRQAFDEGKDYLVTDYPPPEV